jgi:ABC-type transport system involved in multi-copper enzyme maturation permease subunit
VTPAGIATVARQEFTIRIRAGRWRWLLIAWFTILTLFTLLMRYSIARVADPDVENKGVVVYGALTLLVLALALLVVPALAAQSVNGDRERGTLATLQVTRLTPGDIAVGKLAAAWGTSLVFLGLTLPLVFYCMFLGGVPLWRVVALTLVIALLLGTVVALALCLSALLARTTTSGVLAYLVVFALTAGTLIAFGIGTAVSRESFKVRSPAFCIDPNTGEQVFEPVPSSSASPEPSSTAPARPVPGDVRQCQPATTYDSTRNRVDHVWWLLAPNPFVILADAAPRLPPETVAERERRERLEQQGRAAGDLRSADPLGGIGREVRGLRLHPGETYGPGDASFSSVFFGEHEQLKVVDRRAVWPYGLAFDVLLGAGAVWLTARRLTTPTRKLPKGQRVA